MVWNKTLEDLEEFPPIAQLDSTDVILWNYKAASILYTQGFFGKPLGERKIKPEFIERPFVLSYFDTLYLLEHNIIRISKQGQQVGIEEFKEFAIQNYEDFINKYFFYKFLRKMNFVVRPGMKFGSDFIVYSKGPGLEHSQWVFHAENQNLRLRAIRIVRAGRLAQSVKKKYMVAIRDEQTDQPKFFMFERVKI